jgi:hypothetical protein
VLQYIIFEPLFLLSIDTTPQCRPSEKQDITCECISVQTHTPSGPAEEQEYQTQATRPKLAAARSIDNCYSNRIRNIDNSTTDNTNVTSGLARPPAIRHTPTHQSEQNLTEARSTRQDPARHQQQVAAEIRHKLRTIKQVQRDQLKRRHHQDTKTHLQRPAKSLTSSSVLKLQSVAKKKEKKYSYHELHTLYSPMQVTLINTKTCLIRRLSTSTAHKQSPTPHKALNLTGGGRGRRDSFEQKNQRSTQQAAQIIKSKTYKIRSISTINLYCNCFTLLMQGITKHMAATSSRKVSRNLMLGEEEFMEIDSPQGSAQKRSTEKAKETMERNSNKKSKSGETLSVTISEKTKKKKLWLGFSYMEQLAVEAGTPECMTDGPTEDLVAMGYLRDEAEELQQAVVSFPRVPQRLYPSTRSDKVLGQYYNLTQIPFEVATNPDTRLSLDFHITIYFEQPKTHYEHDEILEKAQKRFEQMSIPLGNDILHPITVLCKHTKQKEDLRIWAGIIKVHLLKPETHAIDLLRGNRSFILQLDNGTSYLSKVAKDYDAVARNNLLLVKFENPNLQGITAHDLYKLVLEDSFERNLEYEVTRVQKATLNSFAWVVATTPNQAAKIKEHYIGVQHEILHPIIPKGEAGRRRTEAPDQKEKRDCLKLCLYNLPKRATMEMITHAIKEKMGTKNVVDIYYLASEEQKHSGRANVECLNPIVYKQFLDKTIPILGSYVEFTPHPKSLEGSSPPVEEQLKKFGFYDNNTALVNIIEALENRTATNTRLTKEDVEAIVEIGGKKLKREILDEAQAYAEKLHNNMKSEVLEIQKALTKALEGMQNITTALLPSSSNQLNGL